MPTPNPSMPDPLIIAATLHHLFTHGRLAPDRLYPARRMIDAPPATMLYRPAVDETDHDLAVCPTCEGDCTVPACTDPACACEMDPPCKEVACPECGGIGSV